VVIARLPPTERRPNPEWSAPLMISCGGVGFGATFGVQITDTVLYPSLNFRILNNDAAVRAFTHAGNVTLGGQIAVSVGVTGRCAEASQTIRDFAPIYSYSKSKGIFVGVSLEGTVIIARYFRLTAGRKRIARNTDR
jgi:SH3 domain-containing YSC84-like protein 1